MKAAKEVLPCLPPLDATRICAVVSYTLADRSVEHYASVMCVLEVLQGSLRKFLVRLHC